ncbi:hypothetical protein GO755_34975 [Spirosoma sp. HMF4905]|uniref:Apea-like HEPN domain-containing protein n=1 Tax=Spirosoma arboris TaxID=2682092 RepID=A0A7K1SN99_9BACT|nr:HEPN domain-containing protein [Spirosoma arboris]MVM35278.1 hypothetical protein [Spirosoma arboris]
MAKETFAFIGNVLLIDKKIKLPYEIVDNQYLERATEEQVLWIKGNLIETLPPRDIHSYLYFYEQEITIKDNKIDYGKLLTSTNWNYYVIVNRNSQWNHELFTLRPCLYLQSKIFLPIELHWPTAEREEPSPQTTGEAGHLFYGMFTFVNQAYNPIKITKTFLNTTKKIYKRYETLSRNAHNNKDFEYRFILTAIEYFRQTSRTSDFSKMKILEYFSILELLLTHAPQDTGDSLTKQLINKLFLLNNRLKEPIDYRSLFGNIEFKKLITSLYAYRSRIAHGSPVEYLGLLDETHDGKIVKFKDKELQVLVNSATISKFLIETITKLLIYSLEEPQLFKDLKAC